MHTALALNGLPSLPPVLPPTQRGGSLVLRRLCAHLGAERVFVELSLLVDEDQDTTFASSLLQVS